MPYVNGVLFNMSLKRNPESKPQWIISDNDLVKYFGVDLAKSHDGFIPKNNSQILEIVGKSGMETPKKRRGERGIVFQVDQQNKKEVPTTLTQNEIDKEIHRLKLVIKVNPGNFAAKQEKKRLRKLTRRVQKIRRKIRLLTKGLDQIT